MKYSPSISLDNILVFSNSSSLSSKYNGKLIKGKPEYEECKKIALELNIPIKYIGIGEKIDDIKEFNANEFVDSII